MKGCLWLAGTERIWTHHQNTPQKVKWNDNNNNNNNNNNNK